MPRQNRRRRDVAGTPARPAQTVGERHEQWRGVEYVVRSVTGAAGTGKAYRCPGCDQSIRPGQPHVVAWPVDDPDAVDRRHWHTPCWTARDRRGPGVQRSRSAPRY